MLHPFADREADLVGFLLQQAGIRVQVGPQPAQSLLAEGDPFLPSQLGCVFPGPATSQGGGEAAL